MLTKTRSKLEELKRVSDDVESLFSTFDEIEGKDIDDDTVKLHGRLEDLGYSVNTAYDELGDIVDVIEDSYDNDIEPEKFSQINPKDYIYWLFNTDLDNKKQELIDELSYWNSGRGEV